MSSDLDAPPDAPAGRQELHTWGEIANYLRCDERTAQRWEVEGLPVHRHMHSLRGRVYAYTDEIEQWRRGRDSGIVRRPQTAQKVLPVVQGASGPFGGHVGFVVFSSVLYAALNGISLIGEVAYGIDSFPEVGSVGGVIAAVSGGGISAAALALDSRAIQRGRKGGLLISTMAFVAAGAALFIGFLSFLPTEPIVRATFETYSGQGGYLKALAYTVPLGVVFLALPFHAVLRAEHGMAQGDLRSTLALLPNSRGIPAPFAGERLKPSWLYGSIVVIGVVSAVGATHLFRNLEPGRHMDLFTAVVLIRIVLWFTLAIWGTVWFHRSVRRITKVYIASVAK